MFFENELHGPKNNLSLFADSVVKNNAAVNM